MDEQQQDEPLGALTSQVLIPFRTGEVDPAGREVYLRGLLGRALIRRRTGEPGSLLWKEREKLPDEVLEFFPALQQALIPGALPQGGGAGGRNWRTSPAWLEVPKDIVQEQFQRIRFGVEAAGEALEQVEFEVTHIHLALLTLDAGVLSIRWQPAHGEAPLDRLVEGVNLFRHLRRPTSKGGRRGRVKGIQLLGPTRRGKQEGEHKPSMPHAAYRESFGPLAPAVGRCHQHTEEPEGWTSLATWANWLLLTKWETSVEGRSEGLDLVDRDAVHRDVLNGAKPIRIQRVDASERTRQHVHVKLQGKPTQEILDLRGFQLRRAFSAEYLAPGTVPGDRVLTPRAHVFQGISRMGVVQLTWPSGGLAEAFEDRDRPHRFQQVYAYLHMLVLAERYSLATRHQELSAFGLVLRSREGGLGGRIQQCMETHRQVLERCVGELLSVTGSDCGGAPEYQEFYGALRQVFDMDGLVQGLSRGLADVRYLEERLREEETARAETAQQSLALAMEEQTNRSVRAERRIRSMQVALAILAVLFGPVAFLDSLLAAFQGTALGDWVGSGLWPRIIVLGGVAGAFLLIAVLAIRFREFTKVGASE